MTEWENKGCFVCRRLWEKGRTPHMVAESIDQHAKLYKCDSCNTFWEEYERYADVVNEDYVRIHYPSILDGK